MTTKNLLGPASKSCPTRALIDQLADKWAILILLAVAPAPIRFNTLKRTVDGITQKMLGQTLRRLEWNGIVARRVLPTMPVTVEYALTGLGRSLMPIVEGLRSWSMENITDVQRARRRFETRTQASSTADRADRDLDLSDLSVRPRRGSDRRAGHEP